LKEENDAFDVDQLGADIVTKKAALTKLESDLENGGVAEEDDDKPDLEKALQETATALEETDQEIPKVKIQTGEKLILLQAHERAMEEQRTSNEQAWNPVVAEITGIHDQEEAALQRQQACEQSKVELHQLAKDVKYCRKAKAVVKELIRAERELPKSDKPVDSSKHDDDDE